MSTSGIVPSAQHDPPPSTRSEMPDQAYVAPDEGQLLSRFWRSASGFWKGRSAWRAWPLVVLLVATVLLQLWVQYGLNFWNRDFFDAIGRRDAAGLWEQALRFVPLAAASIFLAIVSVWGRMTMQRTWREWLSNHLYDYWLEKDHYVRLRLVPGDHQAPEFRIAEDVRIATDLPIDLTIGLFSSCLTAITFIGVLWSVGDGLAVSFTSLTLNIPAYLVVSVVVYSLLLSAATLLIARHLVHVLEESKRSEAELRSIGTHLRETGEGTALKDDRKDGRQAVGRALKAVIDIWRTYCWQLMRLTLITHASVLMTPIVGLLLCTPKYLAGAMSLGEVVQAAAAFVIVTSAFNWFTDNYVRLAEWASSANRVASLLLGLDQIDRARTDLKGSEE
jgi:vitamin B12/bleomycin/antimicrobial peptide transport system ATP-binding/permease protein